jgi:hypothetical protein
MTATALKSESATVSDASLVVWLRCPRRFLATHGTWPEQQARKVAAAFEDAGMTVLVLPEGERPRGDELLADPLDSLGAKPVEVVRPGLHHHAAVI